MGEPDHLSLHSRSDMASGSGRSVESAPLSVHVEECRPEAREAVGWRVGGQKLYMGSRAEDFENTEKQTEEVSPRTSYCLLYCSRCCGLPVCVRGGGAEAEGAGAGLEGQGQGASVGTGVWGTAASPSPALTPRGTAVRPGALSTGA